MSANQRRLFNIQGYGGSILMNDPLMGLQRYIIAKPSFDANIGASTWNMGSAVIFMESKPSSSMKPKYVRLSINLGSVASLSKDNIVLIMSDQNGNVISMTLSELDSQVNTSLPVNNTGNVVPIVTGGRNVSVYPKVIPRILPTVGSSSGEALVQEAQTFLSFPSTAIQFRK